MLDETRLPSSVRRCNRAAKCVTGLHARAAWLERSLEQRSSFLRQTDRVASLLCVLNVRACVRAGVKACSCLHRVLACVFCMHASVRVCVRVCTCHASTCKRVRVREHVREHVRERARELARVPSGVSARARARSLRRDSRFQSSMTRSSSPRAMRSAAGPRGLVAAQAGVHGGTLRA